MIEVTSLGFKTIDWFYSIFILTRNAAGNKLLICNGMPKHQVVIIEFRNALIINGYL